MKIGILLTVGTLGLVAMAADPLHLYEECAPGARCRTLPALEGPAQAVAPEPVMGFDDANVTAVSVDRSQPDPQWVVVLNAEATRQFAELSRRNLGKKLFIVVKERIVLAPTVRQAIEGGSLAFSGGGLDVEKELPWLWSKAVSTYNEQGREIEARNRRNGYLYLALAIPLLLGSLLYVLRAPKPARTVDEEA
jgi:hypothetical protein